MAKGWHRFRAMLSKIVWTAQRVRLYPGNAHLNSEGGRITYWLDLLSLQDLLVRNQLHLCLKSFFSTSKQLSPNQKGQEVSRA